MTNQLDLFLEEEVLRKMDSDAEGGTNTGTLQRVSRRRRMGEQAGAGEDAQVLGVEDAGVDAHGQAQVIGGDDQLSKHGYLPEMRNTWAASASPARNSRHGTDCRRSCSTTSWFSN